MTQAPLHDFVPVAPNPYIVGNPVRDRTVFFGREAEFELVRRRFHGEARGGLLVFCGERRSGKTSILFQIVDGRLGPEFIPVLVDMQSMAISSEADFLAKIAAEVLAATGGGGNVQAPEFVAGSNHAARFQAFIAAVLRAHPSRKLILLFDEYELFENKIDSGVLSEDVLNILAGLMEHQSVFMVFTGSHHLEERRRDYWKILGKSIYKRISYLDREDAIHLIRRPVAERVHYEDDAVDLICRLTAGQAFYTQAVCQSLIDRLNEVRSHVATAEQVAEVVAGMVENPLPQMLFLWDSLEKEEKLVLALLAERLHDSSSFVPAAELHRTIRRREYPLELDKGHIATALEKLFQNEFLLKDGAVGSPGYSFRMDLWRLWIRRMHSVWQVMRELGMSIQRPAAWKRYRTPVLVGLSLAAAGTMVVRFSVRPVERAAPAAGAAWLALEVTPAQAAIYRDGQQIAIGSFRGRIDGDRDHELRFTAAGWADTVISARVAAGDSSRFAVTLRPRLGELRIETDPAGADIVVDGRPRGRSPVTIGGLEVPVAHRVEASLPGRGRTHEEVRLDPDRPTSVRFAIPARLAEVFVTTEPSGALVLVDGVAKGVSPLRLGGLTYGHVRFEARLVGHVTTDTTIEIREGAGPLRLVLREEAPGTLVVQGDRPGQIYVDNDLVAENVPNSQPLRVRVGNHKVQVILAGNEVVDSAFVVRSGERVVYDYSRRTLTRTRE